MISIPAPRKASPLELPTQTTLFPASTGLTRAPELNTSAVFWLPGQLTRQFKNLNVPTVVVSRKTSRRPFLAPPPGCVSVNVQ